MKANCEIPFGQTTWWWILLLATWSEKVKRAGSVLLIQNKGNSHWHTTLLELELLSSLHSAWSLSLPIVLVFSSGPAACRVHCDAADHIWVFGRLGLLLENSPPSKNEMNSGRSY